MRPSPRPPAPDGTLDPATADLLERAARLEKYPLGRLVSLVEQAGEAARPRRAALFRHLAAHPDALPRDAGIVGITGTPGAGKSTLIGRVALDLLAADPALRVAILAIDPTSAESHGALLGDRVRTRFPAGERRLYFRSQATQGDLGGLSRRTFAVTRLLRHLFDVVFIETVGIGQGEIEVKQLADTTILVLQPLAGDHVQFMKAGVMEIPDAFVVNKCDEERLARRSLYELRTALSYARIGGPDPVVLLTSATTGRGIAELAAYVLAAARRGAPPAARRARERFFLDKAVADRWGRFGVETVGAALAARPAAWRAAASYEELEDAALAAVGARIR